MATTEDKTMQVLNWTFASGSELTVKGVFKANATRFTINLGRSPESIAAHIDLRFKYAQDVNVIVLNSSEKGEWKTEERGSSFPFEAGKEFECCCCLPKKESRRELKEHGRLHEMSETLSSDRKPGSAKPFTAQNILVTSDLEMPTAQIENEAISDLEMSSAQIKNEAISDLEMPSAQIENEAISDLEMPSAQRENEAISDLEMPSAQIENEAISDLEMPTAQIENEAISDLEMPTAQIENEAISDLEMPSAQIENEAISDLEMPTAQIENEAISYLEKPSAQIENEAISYLEKPSAQIENEAISYLEKPSAQIENEAISDLEMPTAQIENEATFDLEMPTAQIENEATSDLETLPENVEQNVLGCGSEQEEQVAVCEIHMKTEITAPHCEVREENGPCISEESFEFHRVLGRGGFGKVLLAELKESGQYYAVKTLAKANFLETEELDSLRTERRVLMLATGSPFLSRLHCIFQTEDYVFLVMEYISGGNLRFHLDQCGYFDLDCVRFYAAEIICGLQFLHSNGVIYRDLKAENVMLGQDGHIKIVDFGISKENMSGDSRTKTFCGSPHYMAPEIYQEQEYSTAVDWWAFGVLLFQMLTGDSPFLGEELDELCKSVCSDTPEYPNWMNGCTRDLLGKLLQRDPDRRLGTSGNIRAHPFFAAITWDKIERREVEPPYKPELNGPRDCSYFEEEFLDETPWLSQAGGGSFFDQSEFFGFSFVNAKFAADIEHK